MKGLARLFTATLALSILAVPALSSADVEPGVITFVAPKDIKFVRNDAGTNETAVLFGDPS